MTALKARFDSVLPTLATHTDIATLESKITKVELTLIKWFAGMGIAIITVFLSAMGFFFSSIHSVQGVSPQPIVITLPAPIPQPSQK
jgi:hypothetical protein